jgi:hypothetical protein
MNVSSRHVFDDMTRRDLQRRKPLRYMAKMDLRRLVPA